MKRGKVMEKNNLIKKGVVVAIVLLFVSVSVIPSTGTNIVEKSSNVSFDGNTLYVGGSGPNNYTRIQDAIDNASVNDTIIVFSGLYFERVKVNKTLNLIGIDTGGGKPIVDANQSGAVFTISADKCMVDGFVAQKAGVEFSDTKAGFIISARDCTIKNSVCRGYSYTGIYIKPEGTANNAQIINNTITAEIFGIYMPYEPTGGSTNLYICGNTITDTSKAISLHAGRYNYLYRNNVSSNSEGILIQFGGYNNITENNISYNSEYGLIIYWNDYPNTVFRNTIFRNLYHGILLNQNNDETIVKWNTITGNIGGDGITIWNCQGCDISENNIERNIPYGMSIKTSKNCYISLNNFLNNIRAARFVSCHPIWVGNYWNKPRKLPKPIFGRVGLFGATPWVKFDFYPLQKPYPIGE